MPGIALSNGVGRDQPEGTMRPDQVEGPTEEVSGQVGVAGERGAEAIMPLARGPDGRLGVASSGGGSPMNVTFNVQATDADSFARSESQIAALLSRAVSMGQRNL